MTRYRIIDTMTRESEQYLNDDVPRAVGENQVYILEEDSEE